MEFISIDVETANADVSSICQIGIALYSNGLIVDEWKSYVNPKDYFDGMNIQIHGITEETVKNSPCLSEISSELYRFMDDRVSVCHTHFDRVSLFQAFEKNKLRLPRARWLDSAKVARRAWVQFSRKGYGLKPVCAYLGYEFLHHDALQDAKAAGHIINCAVLETGIDVESWLMRVNQAIDTAADGAGSGIEREGNPEGALHGEILVFTGALDVPRKIAADMAARVGIKVDEIVTKKTTILVVGDQDVTKLARHQKSSKHRKAEKLIDEGQGIRILRETDFVKLAKIYDPLSSSKS